MLLQNQASDSALISKRRPHTFEDKNIKYENWEDGLSGDQRPNGTQITTKPLPHSELMNLSISFFFTKIVWL